MLVKIVNKSLADIDIMYTACRTCYSNESPINIYCDNNVTMEDKLKLIKQVSKSGHLSIFEHVSFTFLIEGISRACSQQLERHRLATYSQQSQRYCDSSNCGFVIPDKLPSHAKRLVDSLINNATNTYSELLELGVKKEDARSILPICTKTNLVMTINLRQLIHVSNLRLCNRAQSEIRELFKEIKKEVTYWHPWLEEYLVPICEKNGFCSEHKCCGRKKHISEIKL